MRDWVAQAMETTVVSSNLINAGSPCLIMAHPVTGTLFTVTFRGINHSDVQRVEDLRKSAGS